MARAVPVAQSFAARLVAWQRRHGRHDLPWQATRDPYRIWLSEIMLQQTQVATVIPYYARFLARFPDLAALAAAPEDDVLRLWSGLGYYSRARNLHRAARRIVESHAGEFPRGRAAVEALPGVGRSTAAAILVFARGERHAILDGNVKRVIARHQGVEGWPGAPRVERELWARAEALLPRTGIDAYTQGLMDLGATVCTRKRPRCEACPVRTDCVAAARGLTDLLPHARPRKRIPERRTAMLVLLRAGEVLLEKRPAPGVWGGLWSLPEVAPDADAAAHCGSVLGIVVDEGRRLPALAHGFTHFKLHIEPRQYLVRRDAPRAEAPGRVWLPVADAVDAAVPVPVRKILRGLLAAL